MSEDKASVLLIADFSLEKVTELGLLLASFSSEVADLGSRNRCLHFRNMLVSGSTYLLGHHW